MARHFLTVKDFSKEEIAEVIDKAIEIKADPKSIESAMKQKTLLMLFDKASLRTRVSFETGMTRMGGHGIYYNIETSPLGRKETIEDTAKCLSRYCDIIMARIAKQEDLQKMAENSSIPVINAMTNYAHPCQIMADLQTIKEKKGTLKGLKLTFVGCGNNNVTHSLIFGCALAGLDVYVAAPKSDEPLAEVVEEARKISDGKVVVTNDPLEAVNDADVIYADSWMSYHIPPEEKEERKKIYMPYQVNAELMKHAKPDAIFMNCLPAMRGMEQTADVIDGPQSVVFDQAENRLHAQNAIMLKLLGKY